MQIFLAELTHKLHIESFCFWLLALHALQQSGKIEDLLLMFTLCAPVCSGSAASPVIVYSKYSWWIFFLSVFNII